MIALCDVEYNDVDRNFQKWHTRLKGGLSDYEQARRKRTQVSRYRKTRALLREILFLRFDQTSLENLGEMRQGRNSNGKPRPVKYMIDLEALEGLIVDRIRFTSPPPNTKGL